MRRWLITKLGGYPDIHTAIKAIKAKDSPEKYDILALAVRRLYNTIGPDDILSQNKDGEWKSEGKILTDGQKKVLISEAQTIINTFAWKILQADVKYKANKMMYMTAVSASDIASGKLWTLTLDTINTRLKSLAAGSGHFNKD